MSEVTLYEARRREVMRLNRAWAAGPYGAYWRERGLSTRAILALAAHDCRHEDAVRAVGEDEFMHTPGCGRKTVAEIGDFIGGWRYSSPVDEALVAGWRAGVIAAIDAAFPCPIECHTRMRIAFVAGPPSNLFAKVFGP